MSESQKAAREILTRAASETEGKIYTFNDATLLIEVGSGVMPVEKVVRATLDADLLDAETERGERYVVGAERLVGVRLGKGSGVRASSAGFTS